MRLDSRHAMVVLLAMLTHGAPAQSPAPTLNVDAAASQHPISPNIYGIASYGLDATFAKEIQVPNIRWGGDGTSRYNWMVDSSNAGFDWYFMGGNGQTTPVPGASADLMINTYQPANALITIPILPYVNKTSAWNCSFPVSVYGAQQATNPYVHPNGDNCGNSLTTTGTQLLDSNILANHIANTTSLQQQWVQHLMSKFGTAANGGVKYYQLDNEPFGWSNTHRDVMPVQAPYATIAQLGQQYAAAVKQADSSALVLGPSDFTLGGWVGNTSAQGGVYAGEYYLQQMAAYDHQHGQRILDYFDEHYYFDTSTPTKQLASTRTLWDATYNGGTWVEQYDFDGPMQLIPRFRTWISANYPGTLLSLSEYSIDSGQKSIVDAIAEMDVLGIFGREPLDFANMWNTPAPTDPIAYAFRMFRNYDGKGGQFGDVSINAASSNQGQLSIYAAQRSSDHAVTILVINKSTASVTSTVGLANIALPSTAQVYSYSAASLTSIAHPADVPITSSGLNYTFPGYSAVMLVVQPAAAAVPATTTTLSASASQVTAGQSITLNVAVAAASGPAPAGSVTFLDGTATLGTAVLANGTASFSIASLAAGSHSITASYGGESSDGGSTSNAVAIQVNPAGQATATSVLLTASPSSATAGQAIQLTAAVSGTGVPGGTVTFQDGGAPIGTAILASGSGTVSLTTLSVGTHSLIALYGGDTADLGSMSTPVTVTITAAAAPPSPTPAADYSLSLSSSTLTIGQGATGSLMVAVAPQNGFSGTLSFACSGMPSGWGCSFAPATISAGTAQSTKLTISSTSGRLTEVPSGLMLALVSPISLLWLGLGRRSKRAQLLLMGLAVLVLAGCSTSPSTTPTTSQPQKSTNYNVTVTASGSAVPTHTQMLLLTVTQ